MSIFSNFFHVKQKPIFTGYRFGFGSASGPTGPTGPTFNGTGGIKIPSADSANGYVYHLYTGNSDFVVTGEPGEVEMLIVAGGGGGGYRHGGGGGAGQAFVHTFPSITPGTYPTTVGAGGNKSTGQPTPRSGKGGDSIFNSITAGGGGGGGPATEGTNSSEGGAPGRPGTPGGTGSGGGSRIDNNYGPAAGGQPGGRPGGVGGNNSGGGGGGAAEPGNPGQGNPNNGAPGGAGLEFSNYPAPIFGPMPSAWKTAVSTGYFAGGGGGGGNEPPRSNGGAGGGGRGNVSNGAGEPGVANTGGGGGGGGGDGGANGGDGGTGIIILRYLQPG